MKEVWGNIWGYHDKGHWIVITTNGTVRKNGSAVMGRGVALQAKVRYPNLPYELGALIRTKGNLVFLSETYKIITLPVKHNWWEKADLNLIDLNCEALAFVWMKSEEEVYMVRPGCGNGQLDWKDVKPILEKYLDDRFIVVEKYG